MEGASTDKLPHDSGWLTFAPTSNTKNLDADFKNPRVEFQIQTLKTKTLHVEFETLHVELEK